MQFLLSAVHLGLCSAPAVFLQESTNFHSTPLRFHSKPHFLAQHHDVWVNEDFTSLLHSLHMSPQFGVIRDSERPVVAPAPQSGHLQGHYAILTQYRLCPRLLRVNATGSATL
jgi:hypothetical protein